MNLTRILFFALIAIFLTSCQKDIDWTVDPSTGIIVGDTTTTTIPGGSTSGDLLVKVVSMSGAESITTTYTYDSSKRLISEYSLGSGGGMPIDTYKRYYRDYAGRIYKISQMIKQTSVPVDTAFTYVYYDDSTSKNFVYTTSDIGIQGFTTHDSTVYTFDGNGNLALQNSYMSSSLLGTAPALTTKWEFIYSGGNLIEQKSYTDLASSGTLALAATYKFTYDNRVNPIMLSGEAYLTGKIDGASKNNVTKMEIVDISNGLNYTVTTTLNYDATNKPATGTSTLQPGNQLTKYTFYYQ